MSGIVRVPMVRRSLVGVGGGGRVSVRVPDWSGVRSVPMSWVAETEGIWTSGEEVIVVWGLGGLVEITLF